MSDPSRRPTLRGTEISASGTGTLAFGSVGVMARLYVRNRGEGVAYMAFGTTAPAAATPGSNKYGLAQGDAVNLDDIEGFTDVSFRVDSGGSAILEAFAMPNPGSSGQGVSG